MQEYGAKTFLVHTHNKQNKTFEINNIYISFLSVKGCSISVKVKFLDLKGLKRVRYDKDDQQVDYVPNSDNDPFRELRK